MEWSPENENILAFKRSKEETEVYFIGNLSNQVQSFILDVEGTYEDLLLNKSLILNKKKIQLAPWQYYLLNKVSP